MADPNLPKPDGQRRRRNASPSWRYLPAGPSGIEPPPMPKRNRQGRWTNDALSAWREWWASPMALAWVEADKVALKRALRLLDDLAAGRSDNHGALTALEDRLGLTPKARRALSWEIERAKAATLASMPPPREGGDPRLKQAA
jgi:hypothetical protein